MNEDFDDRELLVNQGSGRKVDVSGEGWNLANGEGEREGLGTGGQGMEVDEVDMLDEEMDNEVRAESAEGMFDVEEQRQEESIEWEEQ